jgi:hypothetical protein
MHTIPKITSVFLALMALVHAFRVAEGWEVHIGGVSVPIWASAIFLVIDGGLALALWKAARSYEKNEKKSQKVHECR